MTWEGLLLWGALGAFGLALLLDLWPAGSRTVGRERFTRRALGLGVGLTTATLALLAAYFLLTRLETHYVFTYTRTDYPWYYRLAGLWGGQQGTLLMWTAFTGLFGLGLLAKGRRAVAAATLPPSAEATLRAIRASLLLVLILLTISVLAARAFAPTPEYLLRLRPSGNGLQAVLITPFMLIHPPIQFVAYGLMGVLFSAGLAHAATGDRAWAALVRPWTRLTVLVATVGLGLGGLWAYYVLNFGGFWAWDPVETANLLAWFPPLLLLHALLRYRHGEYATAAPFFALLTLPMALFATVATRTGLWVSVHAFTDPSRNFEPDALRRFLNILGTNTLLEYLAGLLAATLALALYAALLGRSRRLDTTRRLAAQTTLTGAFAFAGGLFLLDAQAAYGLLFQVAHAITLGAAAPLGLLLIGLAAAALVLLTGRDADPRPPYRAPAHGLARWMTGRRLLAAGITLLAFTMLVLFLLDVLQINGYDRAVYDDRVPFLLVPLLLVLATLFLVPTLGAPRALATSAAAAGIGALLALLWRDHWAFLLTAPPLLAALLASLHRMFRLLGPRAQPQTRVRAAALALILGALVGFVWWANPPTEVHALGFTARPAWGWTPVAYAACIFALAAGAVHLWHPRPVAARVGALLLVPAWGPYGACALAGLVALASLARSPKATRPLAAVLAERRSTWRRATIYLLHAALSLGLLGYAAATYESRETQPFAVDATGSRDFEGYTFRLLETRTAGLDPDQDLPLELHTRILIERGGAAYQEATLTHWLVPDHTRGHYDARVTVVRTELHDLYLFPVALHTPGQVFLDHTHDVTRIDAGSDQVVLTAKVLPAMNLVWAGLWLLALALAGNLALGGFRIEAPVAAARHGANAE